MFSTLALRDVSKILENIPASVLEVQELDTCTKSFLIRYLSDYAVMNESSIIKIQAIIDYMYEQINIGNWKEVRIYLRKTITLASYLKLINHLKISKVISNEVIKESFKIIDFGILFGCPLDTEPKLLQNCAQMLNKHYTEIIDSIEIMSGDASSSSSVLHVNYNANEIEKLDCPSMEHFFKYYVLTEKPVILDNCINHWPALTKWKDQNYFMKIAGLRTVSIELGSQYTDSDWTQKLMTIGEFIQNYIYQSEGPKGYLAQYQLFKQIPELKNDISEPDYCCFTETNEPVDIMAWYGPKGTVSPLHHDPKRNLLAQVVGEKQIFLFSPKDSEFLYPHDHELLNNTARIDPRKPDFDKYPKYNSASPYYCVLHPGQMLYIPPKWWHFVESLSISFSVSFWWE